MRCTEAEQARFLDGDLADDRVVASIALAGGRRDGLFGETGYAAVADPMLAMIGTNDSTNPDDFASMEGVDLTWLAIEDACHQTFALGICDTLETEEGFRIVNTWALAFSRRHLLDDDSGATQAILDGSESVDSRVTVNR